MILFCCTAKIFN